MNTQSLSPVSSIHTNGAHSSGAAGAGRASSTTHDGTGSGREDGEIPSPSGGGEGPSSDDDDDDDDETDALYAALHHRLVTTGEWHRLSNSLEQLLLDSNWSVDLADYASERARGMRELDLDELVKDVRSEGKSTIPPAVKTQLLKQIREFLDRNVEDEEA